jgi:hypothetical protein
MAVNEACMMTVNVPGQILQFAEDGQILQFAEDGQILQFAEDGLTH